MTYVEYQRQAWRHKAPPGPHLCKGGSGTSQAKSRDVGHSQVLRLHLSELQPNRPSALTSSLVHIEP